MKKPGSSSKVSSPQIDALYQAARDAGASGGKLCGAGSGGFLLMICKSPKDAAAVREMLEREPLNESSRFFDFEINQAGLEVTTC